MVAELVDGELYLSPRPAGPHTFTSARLLGELVPFQEDQGDRGGWWIVSEPELHLGEDVVVPDLAGWRCERMPEFPDAAFFTLSPDWLCEVLSPSTKRFDRTKKLDVYAREGVKHVWFAEPLEACLEVLSLRGTRWELQAVYSGDDLVRTAPFEAIAVRAQTLWRKRRVSETPVVTDN